MTMRTQDGGEVHSDCLGPPGYFSVVGAAPAYSALTGVAAGVLFTGVVLLVGTRPRSDSHGDPGQIESGTYRALAIETMVPGFFIFLIATFFFGEMGGEGNCRRAQLEALTAGQLLAVGGVALFHAIAWMLRSFEPQDGRIHEIAAIALAAMSLIAVAQIYVTANDIQVSYGSNGTVSMAFYAYLVGALLVIVLIAWNWLREHHPDLGSWWTASTIFAVIILAVAEFDLGANTDPASFAQKDPPVVTTVSAITVLVTVIIAIAILLLSAPPRKMTAPTSSVLPEGS